MNEILRELAETLILGTTADEAKKLRTSTETYYNFSKNGFDFRLFKAPAGNVTLLVFFADDIGKYYKPIGFYDFNVNIEIEQIFIINEFVKNYFQIRDEISQDISSKVSELSLLQNVFIALGSREVGNAIKKMFISPNYNIYNHMDATKFQVENLLVNNLEVQVKTSMMGALEAVFVDSTNVFDEDYLIMFQRKNRLSIHCNELVFDELKLKGLLSIFK